MAGAIPVLRKHVPAAAGDFRLATRNAAPANPPVMAAIAREATNEADEANR